MDLVMGDGVERDAALAVVCGGRRHKGAKEEEEDGEDRHFSFKAG
jgi:hypothetical protein